MRFVRNRSSALRLQIKMRGICWAEPDSWAASTLYNTTYYLAGTEIPGSPYLTLGLLGRRGSEFPGAKRPVVRCRMGDLAEG